MAGTDSSSELPVEFHGFLEIMVISETLSSCRRECKSHTFGQETFRSEEFLFKLRAAILSLTSLGHVGG